LDDHIRWRFGDWIARAMADKRVSEMKRMNQRDWELLDKQLWGVSTSQPRQSSIIALTIVAVFLIGMALGGFLFPQQSKPTIQMASYGETVTNPNSMPPTMRR
jgi:hypothetical protein